MKTSRVSKKKERQLVLNFKAGTGKAVSKTNRKPIDPDDKNPIVRAIAKNFPKTVENIPPTLNWDNPSGIRFSQQ